MPIGEGVLAVFRTYFRELLKHFLPAGAGGREIQWNNLRRASQR